MQQQFHSLALTILVQFENQNDQQSICSLRSWGQEKLQRLAQWKATGLSRLNLVDPCCNLDEVASNDL